MRKAAENLLSYLEMIPSDYKNLNIHELKAHGGTIVSTGIINNSRVSICQMHVQKKGVTSDWHAHAEGESFVFQEGSPYYIEIEGINECIRVCENRTCYVPPNIKHRMAGSEGESKSILVLIPGSSTFPRGMNGE